MKDKRYVKQAFLMFKKEVKLQIGMKIMIAQCDVGGEYDSLNSLLSNFGIV